jgi:hypothetical protein
MSNTTVLFIYSWRTKCCRAHDQIQDLEGISRTETFKQHSLASPHHQYIPPLFESPLVDAKSPSATSRRDIHYNSMSKKQVNESLAVELSYDDCRNNSALPQYRQSKRFLILLCVINCISRNQERNAFDHRTLDGNLLK